MANAERFNTSPDAAAALLSAVCVVHCIALPFLLMGIGLDGALMHGPHWVHWALLLTALPVSAFALARGFSSHHQRRVPLLATGGFLIMALGATQHGTELETTLSVGGSLLVAGAHYFNWRTGRQAENRRKNPESDSAGMACVHLAPPSSTSSRAAKATQG